MSAGLMAMRSRSVHSVSDDPYRLSVKTLHHFDVDPAANARTSYDVQGALWTFVPYTSGYGIVSGAALFGAKGLLMPAATGQYNAGVLDAATTVTPSWNVGSGDFTIELFLRPDMTIPSGTNCGIVVNDDIGTTRGWLMYTDTTAGYLAFAAWVGGTAYSMIDTTALTVSTWVHVAAVREGGTLRLYRDGVQVGSTSISGSVGAPTMKMIGNLSVYGAINSTPWPGAMDELRITTACRYPGGTTFAVPTAAFPDP